jgi:NAD(P)-dependent dehydrogenase (short-subunit alcohol dehydrogenase family)
MTTTLITGGTKSLGYETARRLIEAGQTVWIGARDETRGQAAAEQLGARYVQLDVTDDDSVVAAAATIAAGGGLDVLINNAGVVGPRVAPEDMTGADMLETFDTNVFGIVRMTTAFLPILRESPAPAIINITSGLGSFATVNDPSSVASGYVIPMYCSSKSAVNMLTVQYAKAFPDIRINAADPGYTATDFNGHSGTQTVAEGTDAVVGLALQGADGQTGTVVDRDGTEAF